MSFSRIIFLVVLITSFPIAEGIAQSTGYVGTEVQVYPAGLIIGARGGVDLGARQEINFRAGYNITDRRDFGKHDNEEGGGRGFGLGYRYYLSNKLNGFFAGVRTDLFFLEIDWRDNNPLQNGTTDIVVLQPTAEVGYDILKKNAVWSLQPTISLGVEINIQTEGEPVGEGAILLGGLNLTYGF